MWKYDWAYACGETWIEVMLVVYVTDLIERWIWGIRS
jgi:hypothetical protein